MIQFSGAARQLCPMSNDEDALRTCIGRVRAGNGTRIDQGIRESASALVTARDGVAPWRSLGQTIYLITAGQSSDRCAAAKGAASAASMDGIHTNVLCASNFCDDACFDTIREGVASGGAAKVPLQPTALPAAEGRELVVTDTLATHMRLVPSSAEPAPTRVSGDGQTIVWHHTGSLPRRGVTMTFLVEPLATGEWPTNAQAWATFTDSRGRVGGAEYPVPVVQVVAGPGYPTATPPATPTVAAPTDTPGPSIHAIHLPVVVVRANPGR